MAYLLEQRASVHYVQRRPMRYVHDTEAEFRVRVQAPAGVSFDCSESATTLFHLAGLHDPNGRGYDGYGFTGTMLGALPHYDRPLSAGVGALCVFGPAPGKHVAIVYEPGADPLMWSHGSEAGPLLVRFTVERAYHGGTYTFLSIAHL